MTESYELFFETEDKKMYGKLDSAMDDLLLARSYGEYILKKNWKAKPWIRGSIYLQQSAFVSAMVVAYGRVFTRSIGWPSLPNYFMDIYDADEYSLHHRIIEKRNKLYAHSDSEKFDVRPWKSELHSDIKKVPIYYVEHSDILALQNMCKKMTCQISNKMIQIKSKYVIKE